jgi:hypothetical protein
LTEVEHPRRCLVRIEASIEEDPGSETAAGWRIQFLEALAETSNVTAAAEAAGVNTAMAYRLRREDAGFARDWRAALREGYEHLEMETLQRLRMGTGKDEPKFDIANALRLLAMHKDSVAEEHTDRDDRDEEALLASLDAKLARIRAREENVTRMLHEEGVSAPRLSGADD